MKLENYACQICGEFVHSPIKAIGGGTVRLCVTHANEFHEYIIEAGTMKEVSRREWRIRILAHKHNFKDTENAIDDLQGFLADVYYGVKAWMREKRMEWVEAKVKIDKPTKPIADNTDITKSP